MTSTSAVSNTTSSSGSLPNWERVAGVDTLLAEKNDTPLVSITVAFPYGGYSDPEEKIGLANFFGDMLLRGTSKRSREQIENELDFLGASLQMESGYHSTLMSGQVLSRNLDRFLELLLDVLTNASFPEEEIVKLREELIAQLHLRLEDDAGLARLYFMRNLYTQHPYGRDLSGMVSTLKAIKRADLTAVQKFRIHNGEVILAAAGNINRKQFHAIVERIVGALPQGKASDQPVTFTGSVKGRHITLVDKPERTQTQFLLGHPSISATHEDYYPLAVFVTAFAGHMFQAKYMQEIRVKRGWSYGAYGSLDARRDGGSFYLFTFPATKDTIQALKLSLELLDNAVQSGLTDEHLEFAKKYLSRSYPFLIDTPEKAISQRIVGRFLGRPDNYLENYVKDINAVTPKMAQAAARKHLSTENLHIVMLCTASDFRETIGKELSAKEVTVTPFDKL